ncbi:MAG: hypothetical protein ABIZ80_24955 [Bryobacteraceae bacterium]
MLRRSAPVLSVFVVAIFAQAQQRPAGIEQAFSRLYNFDFRGAQAALDRYIGAHPQDPLGYAMRSSAYLFYELDRLSILESEFFSDDKRIADQKKLKPDPNVRAQLFQAVDAAMANSQKILESNPNDSNALFAMCITQGIVTDYTALVEKKQLSSLPHIKKSTAYAQQLIKNYPEFYDAYLTTGMTEYMLGSMPFFVRWFIRIDDIKGSKEKGIDTVQMVARKGHYLKPFAKIMLAVAYLREKKPRLAQQELADLSHDYPENLLFKKELAKVSEMLRGPEFRGQ